MCGAMLTQKLRKYRVNKGSITRAEKDTRKMEAEIKSKVSEGGYLKREHPKST